MLSLLLSVVSSVLLAVTLVQDVRERAVSVGVFPLLLLCLALSSLIDQPGAMVFVAWALNVLFLGLQVGGLYLYFLLTRRRLVAVVGTAMGLGDILFWLAAAASFSLPNFVLFFLASLMFSLALHLSLRSIFKQHYSKTVPLAGFQALSLLVLIVVRQLNPRIDFYSDSFMLGLLV